MTGTVVGVAVDPRRCTAYGLCIGIHPDVFSLPVGSATAVVTKPVLDADDVDDVREAVRACPAQALSLVES